jgi:hypothetical protein
MIVFFGSGLSGLGSGNAAVYMGVSTSSRIEGDHATLALFADEHSTFFFDSYLSSGKSITKRRKHEAAGLHFFPGETTSFNVAVPEQSSLLGARWWGLVLQTG